MAQERKALADATALEKDLWVRLLVPSDVAFLILY
jgi:hypothetical protein